METEAYEPELGQAIFGGPWEGLQTPGYVTAGFHVISDRIKDYRGDDGHLDSNYGEPEYVNGVFAMRTYCWCDGDRHPEGCPPNFEHPKSGLVCRWYKHSERGESTNRRVGIEEWAGILTDCLASIPSGRCVHEKVYSPHPWSEGADDTAAYWRKVPYWTCSTCGTCGDERDRAQITSSTNKGA